MQAGFQMMVLPFRLFGVGLQAIAQAMEGGQRTVERNLAPWGGAAPGTGGPPAPWAGAPSAVEPTDRTVIGAVAPAPPIGGAAFKPANFTGNAESGGGAVEKSETKTKEDKDMTCCDNDLSGCELKVVQYSIVSVDPYIKDFRRMVTRAPRTVATSEDMTDADFTAYVVAKATREIPKRMAKYRTKYLRVCYTVICRLAMPCSDYEKDQVKMLRDINLTLMRKSDLRREDLAKYEADEASEEMREEERLEKEDREDDKDGE